MIESGPHSDRVFDIEGHRLGYPTEFRDGCSLMALFVVPTAAADERIAPSGFVAAEIAPRRTIVTVVGVHYADTDCGSYDEIAWTVIVQPFSGRRGVPYVSTITDIARGRVATYSWRLAVSTTLSRDSGIRMWGFPKTVEDLRFERADGRASMSWQVGDATVMRLSVPDSGARVAKPVSPPVYSVFDGAPHVGNLTQSYTDVGYHPRAGELELGEHEIADELEELGLPKRPLLACWNGHLSFRMSAPRPLL